MYDPGELVEKVTGTSLTPESFVQYLTKKYTSLWE
jgi:Zn-dependent M32 family carboxypeptidase